MIKKILLYLAVYFLWIMNIFFFPFDNSYYVSLVLPFFAPSMFITVFISLIIYLLITFIILEIIKKQQITYNYLFILLINYIFSQVYFLFFFIFNSLFLMIISISLATITSLLLYFETRKYNKITAKYLLPYLIWNLYLTITSISIFILNY